MFLLFHLLLFLFLLLLQKPLGGAH
jgi:hypothetical protein